MALARLNDEIMPYYRQLYKFLSGPDCILLAEGSFGKPDMEKLYRSGLMRTHVLLKHLNDKEKLKQGKKSKFEVEELVAVLKDLKEKCDLQAMLDAKQVVHILSSPEYKLFSSTVKVRRAEVVALVGAGSNPPGLEASQSPKWLLQLTRWGEKFTDFSALRQIFLPRRVCVHVCVWGCVCLCVFVCV